MLVIADCGQCDEDHGICEEDIRWNAKPSDPPVCLCNSDYYGRNCDENLEGKMLIGKEMFFAIICQKNNAVYYMCVQNYS